jgi:hypothetical protein
VLLVEGAGALQLGATLRLAAHVLRQEEVEARRVRVWARIFGIASVSFSSKSGGATNGWKYTEAMS